ncbi:MAG: peptide ABC transporter substrate-binding protein [Gammaproteobacteria bacterium]|nr:MAG: peptide ABC transporter substrate-binding protein [Gammaproteobacteria bacterium]
MPEGVNRRAALLPVLLCCLLAGCGERTAVPSASAGPVGGPGGQERAQQQLLRKGNGAEPESLDPHRTESVAASNIERDLFEGLVLETEDGELVPGAAASWEVSADGLSYRFHMRPDARWSNGDRLTARDFEYSLRRSCDPATLNGYSSILYPILNAEAVVEGRLPPTALGVQALDDATLEIHLSGPTPYFLGLLTHSSAYPVHRPSVERYGEKFARPGNLVSNGAYRLEEWVIQSHIRLLRNRYYRDDAHTSIDEVWYYPIENDDAEVNRYRADELDMTEGVPFRQVRWLREQLPGELRIAPYLGTYYFGFNNTRPPFRDNLPLRLALSMAVDRDILTQRVMGTGEQPAWGFVPPVVNYSGQRPAWADWTQEQRNAEARRLYHEAGYSEQHPLEVELLYNTDQNHKRIAGALAAMWKQTLGVRTKLLNQEWKVFIENRKRRVITQVFRSGWIGDYNDAYTFLQLLHSANGQNDPGYRNPAYDALLDQAAATADPAERRALLEAAERQLLADQPLIPLYFYASQRLVKPWVGGYRPNLMDHHHSKDLYILRH